MRMGLGAGVLADVLCSYVLSAILTCGTRRASWYLSTSGGSRRHGVLDGRHMEGHHTGVNTKHGLFEFIPARTRIYLFFLFFLSSSGAFYTRPTLVIWSVTLRKAVG